MAGSKLDALESTSGCACLGHGIEGKAEVGSHDHEIFFVGMFGCNGDGENFGRVDLD